MLKKIRNFGYLAWLAIFIAWLVAGFTGNDPGKFSIGIGVGVFVAATFWLLAWMAGREG